MAPPPPAGVPVAGSLLDRLHENGRAFIEQLQTLNRDSGPLLLVLDECHHLLEVWGRLIGELLDQLPNALVLGLTATPPEALTADQALLVDELFGTPLYRVSIPAVVKVGRPGAVRRAGLADHPDAERGRLAEGGGRAVPGADHPAHRPDVRLDAVPAVAGRAVRGQPVAVAHAGQGAAGRVPRGAAAAPRRDDRAARAAPGCRRSTARHRPRTTGCCWSTTG